MKRVFKARNKNFFSQRLAFFAFCSIFIYSFNLPIEATIQLIIIVLAVCILFKTPYLIITEESFFDQRSMKKPLPFSAIKNIGFIRSHNKDLEGLTIELNEGHRYVEYAHQHIQYRNRVFQVQSDETGELALFIRTSHFDLKPFDLIHALQSRGLKLETAELPEDFNNLKGLWNIYKTFVSRAKDGSNSKH
jgi:hypothetical protein